MVKTPKPMKTLKSEREFVRINGIKFKPGDDAKIREYYDDECFGKIRKISKNGKNIRIRWYYKPKDLSPSNFQDFSKFELFESNVEQEVFVECVYEKVDVLSY